MGSCDGDDTNSGGEGGGITTEVIVLAGGVTETVTISGGEEVVIVSGAGGGGGGGVSSLVGGGGVGWGATLSEEVEGALVLAPSPAKPCTILLKPLTPSQIIPSRFSQKLGRSDMFAGLVCVGGVY